MNMKMIAEQVATAVKGLIKAQFDAFDKRLAAVEARPAPERGEKGDPGTDGKPGKDGSPGVDGKDGLPGADGKPGADGVGKDGAAGKDGATAYEIALRAGFKGDEAAWVQSLRGPQGEKGGKGDAGESVKGDKGDDGKFIKGDKGDNGKDAIDGRDALMLDILPGIDESRSYHPRTYAAHAGGVWVARRHTHGMDGWECVVEGVAAVAINQDNERSFTLTVTKSSGGQQAQTFAMPVLIYRGVWREGPYQKGDTTTWGGSLWHCNEPTTEKPGTGKSWTLSCKRGADAKGGNT